MKTISCFLGIFLSTVLAFGQAEETSLADLKESYLDKRADFASSSSKKFTDEQQLQLNAIVDELKVLDENSFEYNLVAWINGNYNEELKDQLFKAYALNSSDETVLKEMFGFYILTYNTAKQKEFLSKIQKFYTPAEIAYYTDAMPTGKSILITSNQEDMYGFLVAQVTQGIGAEVQIFNMDFMKNAAYREMVSNNTGIKDLYFVGNEKQYLKSLMVSSTKKIVISSTVPQDYFSLIAGNLYLTGLYYQYGNIDQLSALDTFWKKIKTKDISGLVLAKSAEKKLYGNYLPPLITLYMMQPGDQVLKSTIQAIALKVDKAQEVEEILKEIETN